MKHYIMVWLPFLFFFGAAAQKLQPGFNKQEYVELLKLTAKNSELEFGKNIPYPERFTLRYRSATVGLDNVWELWLSADSMAVISIRGSTVNAESWLANFYAAMVPAKGELKLSDTDTFRYELTQNPLAAVHAGWLLAMAFLSKDILQHIDMCYQAGIKDFYMVGHSQGGAISFLMTAYLHSLQNQHLLPADIRFKTYCSAAPKPGNLYFAYAYETMTQGGWAYSVVNAADWVPEVPFSVQTTDDFNEVNPFPLIRELIKKQRFPKNIILKRLYNKLDKPSRKAQKNYRKYLGQMMSKAVQKHIPDFSPPAYFKSNNYVRTGNPVILNGDETYFSAFPVDKEKFMTHHSFDAYLLLAEKL
ncbi:lipase family protein [Agriterribacter sp.]|uniref:lipase family protein n=1 Tax=Agriterribacter sp. TaxID=2821509 RepID=UPI002BC46868|nr:lipase family protein [Agriterribacter sp.]HTN07569.1 lipase family protein [Agriterribacter sp.]